MSIVFLIVSGAQANIFETDQAPHDVYDATEKFLKMEKSHKSDWFKFAKEVHDEKYDLLRKHHDECANLHIKKVSKLRNNGCTEAFIDEQLNKMIELHEKQCEEWRHLAEKLEKKRRDLGNRHNDELMKFKESR